MRRDGWTGGSTTNSDATDARDWTRLRSNRVTSPTACQAVGSSATRLVMGGDSCNAGDMGRDLSVENAGTHTWTQLTLRRTQLTLTFTLTLTRLTGTRRYRCNLDATRRYATRLHATQLFAGRCHQTSPFPANRNPPLPRRVLDATQHVGERVSRALGRSGCPPVTQDIENAGDTGGRTQLALVSGRYAGRRGGPPLMSITRDWKLGTRDIFHSGGTLLGGHPASLYSRSRRTRERRCERGLINRCRVTTLGRNREEVAEFSLTFVHRDALQRRKSLILAVSAVKWSDLQICG
jgi:hypothetical protein